MVGRAEQLCMMLGTLYKRGFQEYSKKKESRGRFMTFLETFACSLA